MSEKFEELEKRIQNVERYLPQSSEIVLNLTVRVAALERLLIKNNLLNSNEIELEVQSCYNELIDKAKEFEGL